MEERFGRCPFYTTQRLIQGKWAILILHYLSGGPVRFNELQRKMPKMTHATLSNQLKQLEAEGLAGYVYTQLSDVEEETNGLLTYDRRVCKLDAGSVSE